MFSATHVQDNVGIVLRPKHQKTSLLTTLTPCHSTDDKSEFYLFLVLDEYEKKINISIGFALRRRFKSDKD